MKSDHLPDLESLRTFVRIADEGSIAAAARSAGLTPSAIGKTLSRMETRLGVRLFRRNTRNLSLTEEGVGVLFRARRIITEADALREGVSNRRSTPSGRLRLSLSVVGEPFLSLLAAFSRAYPMIEVDIDFSDRQVDLIGEGFDAAIRSGIIRDSRLMTKVLGSFRMELAASPQYLAEYGRIETVGDVASHRRIGFRFARDGRLALWPFIEAAGTPPTYAVISNNLEARVAFTLQGVGIGLLPSFAIEEHLRTGRLLRVLDDVAETVPLALLWPSNNHQTAKMRAFSDFIVDGLRAHLL